MGCAADGSTIHFLDYLTDEMLEITDGICIDKNLIIEGLGNPGINLLSISDEYVFKVNATKTVTIKDLILCVNDTSTDPAIENFGDLTLDNITINDKRTGTIQGVIVNKTNANLEVKNLVELLKE